MADLAPCLAAYLRVSPKGRVAPVSAFAQHQAVARHAAGTGGGAIVAEFVGGESGKRENRPQLAATLEACRALRATLVIARFDRLARNVSFVSGFH
jgi:DNA invertase Pin-like site-specific DNA recombinase